jgi:hypothetical protein
MRSRLERLSGFYTSDYKGEYGEWGSRGRLSEDEVMNVGSSL